MKVESSGPTNGESICVYGYGGEKKVGNKLWEKNQKFLLEHRIFDNECMIEEDETVDLGICLMYLCDLCRDVLEFSLAQEDERR